MIEKEVYVRKLVNDDCNNYAFAYVMLEVRKTNYLLSKKCLVLVTKDGNYFIPCSIEQNEKILETFFVNKRIWINFACFYFEEFDEDLFVKYGLQYSQETIKSRNKVRWDKTSIKNVNTNLKIVGSTN